VGDLFIIMKGLGTIKMWDVIYYYYRYHHFGFTNYFWAMLNISLDIYGIIFALLNLLIILRIKCNTWEYLCNSYEYIFNQ
jgi:hypothetical protein